MARLKPILARVLWRAGLISLAGRIRMALRGPRLVVLCYHRIDGNPGVAARSAAPDAFDHQLSWFSRRFAVWSLAQVAAYLGQRESLRRDAIALTFDDGYADNFHTVLPRLRERGFPATFFISSAPLLRRQPYWYDSLWLLLAGWGGEALPASALTGLPEATSAALEACRIAGGAQAARQRALDACKGLPGEARARLMEGLRLRSRADAPQAVCETMTKEEAGRCAQAGVELGGHSRNHPSLARIPEAECRAEIAEGLRELRAAGFTVKHFAYPFGEAADVGGKHGVPRRALSDLGKDQDADGSPDLAVELAVTTEERAVRPDEDPLLVPRKVITPQSLPQIALKLELLAWRK